MDKRPELLPKEERDAKNESVRAMIQAVQSAKLFRQLDRQRHFDTLFLVGDPSEYRPLLLHLLEAQDWKLAYLDHTSLVFKRDGSEWTPAQLPALKKRMASLSSADQAIFLSELADKLVAVRQMAAAKETLEAAQKASESEPRVWGTWAQYQMALGDWTAALASADRALKLDPEDAAALGAKAQSLYAKKRFEEAFAVSSRLLAKLPEDPAILFFHARIAHEARHYSEEIRTLQKLIGLAEASGRADPGYHVYLGQAYAAAGEADQALEELNHALADRDLAPEQRSFAQHTVDVIRQKIGAK
jgi:tetratricopeptide (TPR) repeat protein